MTKIMSVKIKLPNLAAIFSHFQLSFPAHFVSSDSTSILTSLGELNAI